VPQTFFKRSSQTQSPVVIFKEQLWLTEEGQVGQQLHPVKTIVKTIIPTKINKANPILFISISPFYFLFFF
jgi:hypothetical protein